MNRPTGILVLGSTGSIGRQALSLVRSRRRDFRITGLAVNRNIELLEAQIVEFGVDTVAVGDNEAAAELRSKLGGGVTVLEGSDGLLELVERCPSEIVLNALVGAAGLEATLAALERGKRLALANKESLVVGGSLVVERIGRNGSSLIPVDSEHSAIYQCLLGEDPHEIRRILLTASGGPFRRKRKEELAAVTPEEALAHPRWRMGKKISIDSATMMNKGLEVIEAHYLFGVDYDAIEVVVHPQSIVHSMVEFVDGSIKAHLGVTDMRIPILFAMSHPSRMESPCEPLDLVSVGSLGFERVDMDTFGCLGLAYEAGRTGGTMPAVLNAANETAVEAFLEGRIGFLDIERVIAAMMERHVPIKAPDVEDLTGVDAEVRSAAEKWIARRQ